MGIYGKSVLNIQDTFIRSWNYNFSTNLKFKSKYYLVPLGFSFGLLPGVSLLSRRRLSTSPVDLAIGFGPGFKFPMINKFLIINSLNLIHFFRISLYNE